MSFLWRLFGYRLTPAEPEDIAHAKRQIALRQRVIARCRAVIADRYNQPADKVRGAERDLERAEQKLLEWNAHLEELQELAVRHADRARVAAEEAAHKARLRAELESSIYYQEFYAEFGCYPDEDPEDADDGAVEFSKSGGKSEEHRLSGKW
ncbi:MAG: hypothetical protein LCH93_01175 [Proteobacteria bacterium]|nr:hypothetical protein [Pseudomonadota bacterium]